MDTAPRDLGVARAAKLLGVACKFCHAYVASDRSKQDAMARVKAMNCLQVEYEGDTRAALKKQFNVWSGSESFEFGVFGRRSGVPALVVLSEDGTEVAFIDAERRGPGSLAKWPLDDAVWGGS